MYGIVRFASRGRKYGLDATLVITLPAEPREGEKDCRSGAPESRGHEDDAHGQPRIVSLSPEHIRRYQTDDHQHGDLASRQCLDAFPYCHFERRCFLDALDGLPRTSALLTAAFQFHEIWSVSAVGPRFSPCFGFGLVIRLLVVVSLLKTYSWALPI